MPAIPGELLNVDTPLTLNDLTYTFDRNFDADPDLERLVIQQLRRDSALTSGTGTYTPFLRQNATGQDTASQGFNTSDADALGQGGAQAGLDMDGPTTAIRLRNIPIVIGPDGQSYYEIRLDLNEENNNNLDPNDQLNRLLALSEFQLYWSNRQATVADYNSATYTNRALGTDDTVFHRVFDIDGTSNATNEDRTIVLRDSNAGSGQDDYIFLIPVSAFAGASADSFVTLFSQFGPNPAEGATFEEWRIRTTTSISGIKFNDADGQGDRDPTDLGLGGFTIQLFQETNGIAGFQRGVGGDALVSTTVSSATDGSFTFYSLLPGTYYIDEINQPGWFQTTGDFETVVIVTPGVNVTGVEIGNFNPIDISGRKMIDTNGNGTLDPGENTAHGGVTIFIDLDDSGTLTGGDLTTITANDGTWSFSGLGTNVVGHRVYENVSGGFVTTINPNGIVITGDMSDLLFANFALGRISGTKSEDLDGQVGGPLGAWTYGAVTIELVQNNVVVQTTQTDASGNYSFNNLLPGQYVVREVTPTGSVVIGAGSVNVNGQVSGFDADVDFANFRLGRISGTKTEDLDGVAGGPQGAWTYGAVTIQLVQNNVVVATTQTDANGNYAFEGLLAGTYQVREVTPAGTVVVGSAIVTATGTTTSGFNSDVDFSNVRLGRISGTKTEDLDGVLGGDQRAWTYGPVTIQLVQNNVVIATTQTDANGNYAFEGLMPGSYIVREVTPTGSVAVSAVSVDASGQTSVSGFNADVDFSNVRLGRISGTKTEDLDGVAGGDQRAWTYGAVTIQLLQNNVVIATTQTDANGNYSFEGLALGTYQVREVTPAGSVVVGSATVTASGTTVSGFDADVDFSNVRLGRISGTKTEDLDGIAGGDQRAWTYGAVTIQLLQNNVVIATTQTDANGNYSFEGLMPGTYQVREVTPTGSVVVGSAIVTPSGTTISGFDSDVDFSNVRLGRISGTKTEDLDGIAGGDQRAWTYGAVTIQLLQNNVVVATTQTDANGNYSFEGLMPGTYQVREITPTGSAVVGSATVTATGTTVSGFDADVDFSNVRLGRISGTKTEDLDGLVGGDQRAWTYGAVTIQLLQNNGVVATTQTDANGNYSFEGLMPGTYQVREVTPTGSVAVGSAVVTPNGTTISGFDADVDFSNVRLGRISGTKTEDLDGVAGGDQRAWTYGAVTIQLLQNNVVVATTQTDANGNYSFEGLMPGTYQVRELTPTGSVVVGSATVTATGTTVSGFDADVDFSNVRLGRISGTKTEDLDGLVGGDQRAWTYGAVTIQLVQNNVVIATTQTDANGNYSFEGLMPGTYQVREVTPAGSVVVGSAIVTPSGTTVSGFDVDVDFSNVRYGTISGTKTEDLDGVVGGDQGAWTYGPVTIELVQNNAVIATTQTDANGNYSFGNLLPGSYIVREVTPAGSVVVGSATVDASGQTAVSGFNADVDFANFRLGRISGTKTEDLDGIAGGDQRAWTYGAVTIQLVQNNVVIRTTQTDANGNYAFEGLLAGTYQVREVTPTGSVVVGSATVTATGTTTSGFNADVDFSNVRLGRISGTKTEDLDGVLGGPQGVWTFGAVTIELVQNNVVIATTQTDASGNYAFNNLLPGSYIVREVTPAGSVAVSAVSVDATGQTSVSGFDADVDFSNVRLGRISGTKTEDLDGIVGGPQGAWTYGSVTIQLVQNNVVIATTQTDANGNYAFEGLRPGSYIVREVTPTGTVAVGSATVDASGQTSTSGFNADVDFANFRLGRISGTKTEDLDGQVGGAQGAWTYGAVTIQLVQNNVVIATTQTGANGNYAFENLMAGTYQVREVTPAGTTAIGSATVTATGTTTSGFNADVDFSNFRNMTISGFKWADLNNNGDWDEANSAVLGGWTIVLDRDNIRGNGNEIATTVTAANGSYSFNIGAVSDADGVLYVYELNQNGFTQTFGNFSFNIASGLVIRGDLGDAEQGNFGNWMMTGANRTPGFWQSTLGQSFYNGNPNDQGDANGDGVPDGNKDFVLEGWSRNDLLLTYGIDSDDADSLPDLFRVYDANNNSVRDAGDIFLTRAQLLDWVSGGSTSGRSFADILRRDVAASFLNTLNNDAIGGSPGGSYTFDSQIWDSYLAAIQFINTHGTSSKKSQAQDWSAYGSAAHIELAAYNESGHAMNGATAFQIRMDGDDFSNPLVQGYLRVQNAPQALVVEDELFVVTHDPVMVELGTSGDFFL